MVTTTFGDRVRDRREAREMSQEQLAKASGVSQSTIAQIERGRNQGTKHILKLAGALGVRPEWLETGRGEMLGISKHKTSASDVSISGQKGHLIKDSLTTRSHRIGGGPTGSADANVLQPLREIPILTSEQATKMTALIDPNTLGEPLGRITIHKESSPSTFAIPIEDSSMEPTFERGRVVVIIDPERPPAPGKYVFARTRSGDGVFRKYREIGLNERGIMTFELIPLNNDYATLHSDRDGLEIIGRMRAHTHYDEDE